MADKLVQLYDKKDESTPIYPNVKDGNIPDNIVRAKNLANLQSKIDAINARR